MSEFREGFYTWTKYNQKKTPRHPIGEADSPLIWLTHFQSLVAVRWYRHREILRISPSQRKNPIVSRISLPETLDTAKLSHIPI